MRRNSSVQRAILVTAMALTAALAVPAAAGTTAVDQRETNQAEQSLAGDSGGLQSAVDRAAGAITALAEVPGYAGVAVDYEAARVTVAWKGDTPPPAGALEAATPAGVTMHLERTALSEADLRAASTRLMDGRRAGRGTDGVIAVLPTEDYAGLVAEVSRTSAAAREDGLTEKLAHTAGVPVRVELVDLDMQPTAASRRNDNAPWLAGGAMATKDGTDYCTTGFSIVTPAGNRRIVSAAHCNESVGSLVRDGSGQRLGKVTNQAPAIDTQLIAPFGSPKTARAVFGGPWNASNASSRYRFPIGAVQRPAVGQIICTSGAVTGEHCGAKIRATNVAWNCGDRTCNGFRASRDDQGVVVGGGDSGGPMYAVIDGKASPRGMIDGGSNRRSCGKTSVSTQCFSYVYGIPMVDILERWNARIDR